MEKLNPQQMENKLEIYIDKDGWVNDISLTEMDDKLLLTVVGEEFILTKEHIQPIMKFLEYHYTNRWEPR